jgi:hypothetical protein
MRLLSLSNGKLLICKRSKMLGTLHKVCHSPNTPCLEMARQMSNHATSKSLRAEAARNHAEAAEIETGAMAAAAKDAPQQS